MTEREVWKTCEYPLCEAEAVIVVERYFIMTTHGEISTPMGDLPLCDAHLDAILMPPFLLPSR